VYKDTLAYKKKTPTLLLKFVMRVQDAASFLWWIALAIRSKNISPTSRRFGNHYSLWK